MLITGGDSGNQQRSVSELGGTAAAISTMAVIPEASEILETL